MILWSSWIRTENRRPAYDSIRYDPSLTSSKLAMMRWLEGDNRAGGGRCLIYMNAAEIV